MWFLVFGRLFTVDPEYTIHLNSYTVVVHVIIIDQWATALWEGRQMSRKFRRRTFEYVHQAKFQISLRFHADKRRLISIFTGSIWISKYGKFPHMDNEELYTRANLNLRLGTPVRRYVFSRCGSNTSRKVISHWTVSIHLQWPRKPY